MSGLRLLLCVDASPGALQAARFTIELAAKHGGEIRAVSVIENGYTAQELDRRGLVGEPAGERLERGIRAVLERITSLAAERGIAVEIEMLEGDPLRAIMADARIWEPELVVIGRTGRSGPGSPMLGSLPLQLVEFAEWPVVVVPEASARTV